MRSPSSAFVALRAAQENQVAGHSLKSEQMYLFILSNLQPTGSAGALSQPLASESWDWEKRELLNCFAWFFSRKQLAPREKSRRTQSGLTHIRWPETGSRASSGTQVIPTARQAQAQLQKCQLPMSPLKSQCSGSGSLSASDAVNATGKNEKGVSSKIPELRQLRAVGGTKMAPERQVRKEIKQRQLTYLSLV